MPLIYPVEKVIGQHKLTLSNSMAEIDQKTCITWPMTSTPIFYLKHIPSTGPVLARHLNHTSMSDQGLV